MKGILQNYLQLYLVGEILECVCMAIYTRIYLWKHTHRSCDSAYFWVVGLKLLFILFDLPGPCTNCKVNTQEPLFPLSP